jgi:hypothetical protein
MSCYFPARSINMDTRQGSQSTASQAGEIKRAVGRDFSAGKRSAASRAQRERRETRTDPHARAAAAAIRVGSRSRANPQCRMSRGTVNRPLTNRRSISRLSAPIPGHSNCIPSPRSAAPIYSQHVSSKFHGNPLKTKDRCPYKPQQKVRPVHPTCPDAGRGRFCGTGGVTHGPILPIYSTHVPSNFRPNSLKTNDGCICKVTHKSPCVRRGFFGWTRVSHTVESSPFAPLQLLVPSAVEGRESPGPSLTNHKSLITNRAVPSLLSSAEALRIIFRCMIVVLYKRNFFEPGEPRWALLFLGPKTIHTSQSSIAFRREND